MWRILPAPSIFFSLDTPLHIIIKYYVLQYCISIKHSLLIQSKTYQSFLQPFSLLFLKCFPSQEWGIHLQLAGESQSTFQRSVIMPDIHVPMFKSFLNTKRIDSSVAGINDAILGSFPHYGIVHWDARFCRNVQFVPKLTNKCQPENAQIMTCNLGNLVSWKWEGFFTKINVHKGLQQFTA